MRAWTSRRPVCRTTPRAMVRRSSCAWPSASRPNCSTGSAPRSPPRAPCRSTWPDSAFHTTHRRGPHAGPGSDKRGIMKLAVIAGDGIGPEVVGQALRVLDKVAPGAQITEYDLGAKRYHATGELMPDGVLDDIRTHDAILLGAIGDPSVPSGLLERNLLLDTRFALDHHVNLRPSKLYPGMDSPLADAGDIDFLVVREGTEGPYTGTGGVIRKNTPDRKSTRLNSSHVSISYAVFCLKKKKKQG